VSGDRFWKFVASKWISAENFFRSNFVANYCPVAFLSETGKNITPADLRSEEKTKIFNICDEALVKTINLLQSSDVVAIGKLVHQRVTKMKEKHNLNIDILYLQHPSPANPAANKGWSEIAEKSLTKILPNILSLD